ncbi:hypothetical protein [Myceligenerans xiligouense]|uniref:Uncharacterized protein n=1 Tax=Myceligenerans xiligouense TaxID=253184 RepID=A0A3N4YFB2_9MICO|nr:hypothetical protein [Myceligenerans xiligouense]RPF19493.1 hypothetical protein EDD34_0041 [Myceligenerans xiligouense]
MSTAQHQSAQRVGAASSAVVQAHLRANETRELMGRASAQLAERGAELRTRLAARRHGLPEDAGLESIEVVVLSVVGLGIAVGLGLAIQGLVESYMTDLVRGG